MSKFTAILYSSLCLLSCNLACGQGKSKTSKTEKKDIVSTAEWTVLVYMNADNNLEEFAIQNFLDMAKVGSSDKVNIIVQFDRHPGYDYSFGDWSKTLRFRVGQGMKPTENAKLEDIGEVNMGDGKTLAQFVSWGMAKYPAKKYMLDIWDHGSGYRLYQTLAALIKDNLRTTVTSKSEPSQKTEMTNALARIESKKTSSFQANGSSDGSPCKSCSHDETDSNELFNREIQNALEPIVGHQKKKFEVMGFDCCLMAMVETAFAFRNTANYMVASEEVEPGEGWRYDDWLFKLVANPTMDGAQLSKVLVSSYRKTYELANRTTTLSAVDLSKMNTVAAAISDLASAMSQSLKPNLAAIKKARSTCMNYAPSYSSPNPYYHVDFIRFCDLIASSAADPILRQKAISVKNTLKSIILENYAGELRRGNFGSYGLAIYFPPSGKDYSGDLRARGGYEKLNKDYPVEFVEKHLWADFLYAYFKEVK